MREILFRGKRIDNGEWEYGDLSQPRYNCPHQTLIYNEATWDFQVDPATVRRILMRWGSAKRNAKNIDKKVEDLRELIDAVTDIHPQVITGMPHGSDVGDPTAQKAERLMLTKAECLDSIQQILSSLGEESAFVAYIDDVLEEFPAAQKRVIELRYYYYGADTRSPWVKIGIKMDKTDKAARRLEERAIARMAKYVSIENM